jgi:hypothetical protein
MKMIHSTGLKTCALCSRRAQKYEAVPGASEADA